MESSNRHIAKNTIYLYLRMIITMLITLYTTRVILENLGIEDFGIYNIVGGITILLSFLSNAMSNASIRFLSHEIGLQGNIEQLRKIFSINLTSYIIIAIIAVFLLETVGLYFIINQLNIPDDRIYAARWVYQFSIITFAVGIIKVPYNAVIIAYEKMSFYAYISIIEVLLKLFVVYLLVLSHWDKLIFYSALMSGISIINLGLYIIYCRSNFIACDYIICWDKLLFKKLISFTGWSAVNGGSVIVTQQGSNILINIFKNVTTNASFAIAVQVSNAIYGLVSNFQMAFQPQIIKLYASNNVHELYKLIFRTSLLSYYLLLIFTIPFILETDTVLQIWLGVVPEYAVGLCQLMLCFYLIDAIQAPLWMLIYGTGNIRTYTIWTCCLTSLNLPIVWLVLKFEFPVYWVILVRVIINFISSFIRIIYVKYSIGFPSMKYVKKVVLPAIAVSLSALIFSYISKMYIIGDSIFLNIISSVIITGVCIIALGIDDNDRKTIKSLLNTQITKWLSRKSI